MNRSTRHACFVVFSAVAIACGSPPPAVEPAPIESSSAGSASAPAASAPPVVPEAAGLVPVTGLTSMCDLTGALSTTIDLSARVEGPALFHLSANTKAATNTKVSIGEQGAAFVESTTPEFTVHGFSTQKQVTVHTASWVGFGGVFFPGNAGLIVKDAHDGKVTLLAPDLPRVTLADPSKTIEVTCADLLLAPDGAALQRGVPPLFEATGPSPDLRLVAKKVISISAEPTGPAVASFDPADDPPRVTVLEQRGKKTRVRWGHLAGWIDTASLVKPPASPQSARLARQAALRDAAEFGMIGLYNPGAHVAAHPDASPADQATPLTCTADVRLVAEVSATPRERFVIGAIPAGKIVHVTDKGADISYVSLGDGIVQTGVRVAVPNRDLTACAAAPADQATRVAAADAVTPASQTDAIDRLSEVASGAVATGNLSRLGTFSGVSASAPSPSRIDGAVTLRQGATQVSGRLPPEVIQRIVRQNFGRFRRCYENGLRTDPTLKGRVSVRLVIDVDGSVKSTADNGSDMPDHTVTSCVVRSFGNLSFPQPEGGTVTVVYPLIFAPGD